MDWNLIRSFLMVADTGTLGRSAKNLGLSQPTLGRHITELEAHMGLVLFIRGRGGMTLTDAGLTLVEDARQMSADAEKFLLKAAGRQTVLRGSVRIAASNVVAAYLLPSILSQFRDAEPDIDIELVASDQVENLLSRDADIALRMVQPTQADLIARKITDVGMGTFATTGYLERFGTPRTTSELISHRLIGYDRSDLIIKEMANLGLDASRDMFAFRTDSQGAYWELVKSGAGIGFGAVYLAGKSPDLVRLVPDLKLPSLPMWLVSHQELKTNLRIRRAADFLYESLRRLPLADAA